MISRVLDDVTDDQLEEVVVKILVDVDDTVEESDMGLAVDSKKSYQKTMIEKTIVRFPNRKHCKIALINRINRIKIDFKHKKTINLLCSNSLSYSQIYLLKKSFKTSTN